MRAHTNAHARARIAAQMTLCILPPSADVAAVALGCNTVHSATIAASAGGRGTMGSRTAVAYSSGCREGVHCGDRVQAGGTTGCRGNRRDCGMRAHAAAFRASVPQWRNLDSVLWCGVHTLFRRLALVDCADQCERPSGSLRTPCGVLGLATYYNRLHVVVRLRR